MDRPTENHEVEGPPQTHSLTKYYIVVVIVLSEKEKKKAKEESSVILWSDTLMDLLVADKGEIFNTTLGAKKSEQEKIGKTSFATK